MTGTGLGGGSDRAAGGTGCEQATRTAVVPIQDSGARQRPALVADDRRPVLPWHKVVLHVPAAAPVTTGEPVDRLLGPSRLGDGFSVLAAERGILVAVGPDRLNSDAGE